MPELPEVETTCLTIKPYITNKKIIDVVIHNQQLRWPVPTELPQKVRRQTILEIKRRGKYLLLNLTTGTLIIHLGMSGSLWVVDETTPLRKHDHVDIICQKNICLRYNDPRRFGCILWADKTADTHPLLANLGPEPLSSDFSSKYLYAISERRSSAIKNLIMNSKVVVGVGNIYANEALFIAGIQPQRKANTLSLDECEVLVKAIKYVLKFAIKQGGTTIRNFSGGNGKPGYFKQKLNVYDRANVPCKKCSALLKEIRLGQRSTFYCPYCQK